jgi:sec-independent protein translocase protein TatA
MFGIGGGELVFIIFIALMLFGSDKIPDVAKTLAKAMAQLKNATNDIKTEITKSADLNGLDLNNLTQNFNSEVDKVKQGFNKMIDENSSEKATEIKSIAEKITAEINSTKEDIEEATGPIKRQL